MKNNYRTQLAQASRHDLASCLEDTTGFETPNEWNKSDIDKKVMELMTLQERSDFFENLEAYQKDTPSMPAMPITAEARNTYEWYLSSFNLLSFKLGYRERNEVTEHLNALKDILDTVPTADELKTEKEN